MCWINESAKHCLNGFPEVRCAAVLKSGLGHEWAGFTCSRLSRRRPTSRRARLSNRPAEWTTLAFLRNCCVISTNTIFDPKEYDLNSRGAVQNVCVCVWGGEVHKVGFWYRKAEYRIAKYYGTQNIDVAKYRNRRISRLQNIEVAESQNTECAKYRKCKISYRINQMAIYRPRRISTDKISTTEYRPKYRSGIISKDRISNRQDIECKISKWQNNERKLPNLLKLRLCRARLGWVGCG